MKWPFETRSELVSDRYAAQIMGMNDRPSTMNTDGPANTQPAMLPERRMRRLASRAAVACVVSSRVVAIRPPLAYAQRRARREHDRDVASSESPAVASVLSFLLEYAN